MKTVLTDRVLWFDGDYTINSNQLESLLKRGQFSRLPHVDCITDDITQFNKLLPPTEQISIKDKLNPLDTTWNLPEQYQQLDVTEYVLNRLLSSCKHLNSAQIDIREQRTFQELRLYKNNNLYDMLRMLIYTVETFKQNNVVWGVGRGSSVASYVLFLIGIHDVDSVLYDLDIAEFFKDV